jgi:hypothetical protein
MRRGYRGGVPRFEIMTRIATAVAAFGLTLAVGAPMLTTMVGGGDEDGTASDTAGEVAMSAATAESPEAELFQTMAAPEESPVPDGQPPSADGPTGSPQGGGGDAGGQGSGGPEAGGAEDRQSDPNGTPAETSLNAPETADTAADGDASTDGVDVLWITQFGLAGLTVALVLATGGMYFMRKRGIGFFR